MLKDNWFKCYGESWTGIIIPEAFCHPAKFSRALIRRIYAHAIEEGWVEKDSVVVDPFGGVALGGLEAMRRGLHWVGVELETRFCALAQDNIDLWNKRYSAQMPNWGTAVIMQGDSRRLGEVLATAQICLSSPPYANQPITGKRCFKNRFNERPLAKEVKAVDVGYSKHPANLGNLPDTGLEAALAVSSPVYIGNTASDDPDKRGGLYRDPKRRNDKTLTATYSEDEAQLAQMPVGDLALALGSPPFIGSIHEGGHGIDAEKLAGNKAGPNSQALIMDGYGTAAGQLAALPEGSHAEACGRPAIAISSPPFGGVVLHDGGPVQQQGGDLHSDYGHEQGQLAQMPPGDHAAALETQAGAGAETGRAELCLSSPPYEGSDPSGSHVFGTCHLDPNSPEYRPSWVKKWASKHNEPRGYGQAEDNIGNETGTTFWAASRQILEEVYKMLAPGGHAIWVLKMFVRSGRLVDFPGQWETLCQSVGFKTVCKHRAWLNKNTGIVQVDFDGEEVSMEKWFKSFFRRLCESKGSPRIDWELVLCMEKS